jgi:hypothetical protein
VSRAADDKERLARTYDRLRGEADRLMHGMSKTSSSPTGNGVGRGGREVWSGPAATRFAEELRQAKAELGKLPGGFARTAHNLRESARELRAQEKQQKKPR